MKQCAFLQMGNRDFAIICGDQAKPLPKCQFCHTRDGENQCDYPTGGKCPKCKGFGKLQPDKRQQHFEQTFTEAIAIHESGSDLARTAQQGLEALQTSLRCHDCAGTGKAMCNRYFCGRSCGVRVSPDEGYCPDHLERAGKTRPIIKERCWWLDEAKYAGTCLRASCNTEIEVGERCLYFPERRRVMDEACGEEYLRVAVEPT
jgi:hypothetical protein